MLKRSCVLGLMVGLVVCAAVSACLAHDVVVPPWRGSAFSTFQDWRFSTSANPAAAETLNNPYGAPSAAITVGQYGSGWLNWIFGLGTMTGYWDLGSAGTIQFTVPNPPSISGASAGWVSVQTTYFEDISQPPTVDVPGAVKVRTDSRVVENVPTGGQWLVEQTLWRFAPCPTSVTAALTSNAPWGSVVDETVVDTCRVAIVSGVGAAKQLPDGTQFELAGAVVTRAFGTFFYVEAANRVAGIRVNCISTQPAPAQGTAPCIIGTIRTIDGERVIDQAVTYGQNPLPIPGALCMVTRSTVGGLSPVGLLVRLAGGANVPSPTATVFTLNDGSGLTVRVQLYGVAAPQNGKFVTVSGALGADTTGPILRVNSSDTIITY